MVDITYGVYIDLNRDGDFSDANENVTAYVKAVTIKRGCAKAFDTVARDTTISIVLSNLTKQFSPEHASALAGFRPGALVKVAMTYSSTVTLAIGRIAVDGIKVQPGTRDEREVEVETDGFLYALQNVKNVTLPLSTDVTTDAAITAIFNAIDVYPYAFTGARVDIPGYMEVDYVTVAGEASTYLDLDTGQNTIPYLGDQWSLDTSVYAMLRDLADAERGLIYERRDGMLAFRSRHYWISDVQNAVDATLTGTQLVRSGTQKYAFGEDVANDVTVHCYPRTVGALREVVARIPPNRIVPAGTVTTHNVSYVDSTSGKEIGASGVLCEATTDYDLQIWSSELQQIVNGDPALSVTLVEGGGGAALRFDNADTRHGIVIAGATDANYITLRGYAIRTFDRLSFNAEDIDSIAQNWRQSLVLDLKLLNDTDQADELAKFELYNRSTARGSFAAITLFAQSSATTAAAVRDLTIGSRIALTETQTGTSSVEYFVVGEEHSIVAGRHSATYVLRPTHVNFAVVGVTGYDEVDSVVVSY